VAFCDLATVPPGGVGKLLLTQLAAVAELEAGLISERTKAALAAYRARGGRLGAALPGAHRLTGGANVKAARRAGEFRGRMPPRPMPIWLRSSPECELTAYRCGGSPGG
jgi:Resolvase, N terminal domain